MSSNQTRTRRIFFAHLKAKLLSPVEAIIGYSEIAIEPASQYCDPLTNRDILRILHAGNDLLDYVEDIIGLSSGTLPSASSLAASSHQIRTYLNLIIGYCELVLEDIADCAAAIESQSGLHKILKASRHLLLSIDDILSFSNLETRINVLDNETMGADGIAQNLVNSICSLDQDPDHQISGRILVVDDIEANRDILSSRLARKGHELSTAKSGTEALVQLTTQAFDLVILDVLLPDVNGYQILQKITESPKLRETMVIIHSAIDEIDTIVRCLEMGAEDYLVKPTNMVVFNARVNSCLEKKYLRDSERQIAKRLEEKQDHLNRELAEAADYVTSLIPEPFQGTGLSAEWRFLPSSYLGGDSLGYHWIDEDHFACYLVDVCGHGIGSALLSVSILNTLNANSLPDIDIHHPDQVMAALNHVYPMENQGGKYFTMWYGVFNRANHTLAYSAAGHPPAILLGGPNETETTLQLLHKGGGPITGFESHYDATTVDLPDYAKLYVFSDGIYEIKMPDGHMLAHSEFAPLCAPPPRQRPKDLDDIIAMMQALAEEPVEDDVSLLSFTFTR